MAEKVKRYGVAADFKHPLADMEIQEKGDYVRYEDFAILMEAVEFYGDDMNYGGYDLKGNLMEAKGIKFQLIGTEARNAIAKVKE